MRNYSFFYKGLFLCFRIRSIIIFMIVLMIFTLTTADCKFQDRSSIIDRDFVFTVEFYPSFMDPCRIILQKKKGKESLSIDNIYGRKGIQSLDRKDLKIEDFDSLLVDKWFRQFMVDTLFLKHTENVILVKKEFQQFKDSLKEIDLSKQKSLDKEVLDGITVYFRFKSDSIDNKFRFRSPHKDDSTEYRLVESIFYLMENAFKTESSINYIERLKNYFDFGLLVKHISDNPIEYRFYGSLSSNEKEEFYNLMKSLPDDKLIIFDFSNFERMGTMFYSDFQLLISRNPRVYWLVNESSKKQVLEMGVKPDRIFNDRQKLVCEIGKRKNENK